MGAAKSTPEPTFLDTLRKYESEISTLLGVLVVIVLAVGLFLLIRRSNSTTPQISDLAETTQEDLMASPRPNSYTVKAGDGLWNIAQEVYNDGYKWTEIAKANNLQAPYTLTAGQELTIPATTGSPAPSATPAAVAVASPSAPVASTAPVATATPRATSTPAASAAPRATTAPQGSPAPSAAPTGGSSYTVSRGDSLWKIAVAQYNDGYKWVEIYRANREIIGTNPGIIVPGQVLTMPGK